jgi:hypothetical protein
MTEWTWRLIRGLLILLCLGLLGYGALRHFSDAPSAQDDEAKKLAELESALIRAASTGGQEANQKETARRTR